MSRPVVLLAILNFVAMAAGFLRETIIAYHFGTTASSDAFAITLLFVEGVTVLASYGLGTFMMVPVVTRILATGEPGEEYKLMETLCFWVLAICLPLLAASLIWPNAVVNVLGPHYSPAQHQLLTSLLRWAVPCLPLMMVAGIQAGVLQAHADYYSPVLGRAAFSATIALAIGLTATRFGIMAGAAGLLAGSVLQLALQTFILWRKGWRPAIPCWWHRALPESIRLGLPTLIAIGLTNIVMGVAQRFIASGLPEGSFAAVNYAQRILNIVANLSLAIGTVSATEVSRAFSAGGPGGKTSDVLVRNMESGIFILTPLCILFYLYSDSISALVFQRGQFGPSSVLITSSCLRWFILSVIPGMIVAVLHRAYPAFSQPWSTVWIAAILTGGTILATAVLLKPMQARALPAGYLIGMILGTIASVQGLRRLLHPSFFASTLRYILRVGLCGAAPTVLVLLLESQHRTAVGPATLSGLFRIMPVSLAFLTVFALICGLSGDQHVLTLLRLGPMIRIRRQVLGFAVAMRLR